MKKLTTEEFIKKAIKIHGYKFDYSRVNYTGSKNKVIIGCKDHGWFEQCAGKHLMGDGCPPCGIIKCANSNRYTLTDFIKKAVEVHGNLYKYDRFDYKNSDTASWIWCDIHGYFKQRACNHTAGQGCYDCGRLKIISSNQCSTEDFIKKAIKKHGSIFDYKDVNYIDSITPVIIWCKNGHKFEQTPVAHIQGYGCADCVGLKPLTLEDFIRRANKIHNNKYSYDDVDDKINNSTKVAINCKDHGIFYQITASHLQGHGCPYCARNGVLTTELFIKKAIEVHGNLYDYSDSICNGSGNYITIICRNCGPFIQLVYNHLQGAKCFNCFGPKKLTTEIFIERAIKIHGDLYNYDDVEYSDYRTKVRIWCKDHGIFYQTPASHFRGCGCPSCGELNSGPKRGIGGGRYKGSYFYHNPQDIMIGAILYIFLVTNEIENFIKVGITKNKIHTRKSELHSIGYNVQELILYHVPLYDAYNLEQKILRELNVNRFYPSNKFGGHTECLEYTEEVINYIKGVIKNGK